MGLLPVSCMYMHLYLVWDPYVAHCIVVLYAYLCAYASLRFSHSALQSTSIDLDDQTKPTPSITEYQNYYWIHKTLLLYVWMSMHMFCRSAKKNH